MARTFFSFLQAIAVAGACVPGWAQSGVTKAIPIRVFNRANVAKADLARALNVASAIFEEAGIAVSWAEGSADDHESTALDFSANATCTGRRMGELHLALTLGPKTGAMPTTLGFALPCAKYGSDASIFVDRCEAVMQDTPASFAKILGHAIAHGIGHVLLGANGHFRRTDAGPLG
jgi:hypothetical protein